MQTDREGPMRTVAPKVVKTALALRALLFLGGVVAGAALLLAAITEKKNKH